MEKLRPLRLRCICVLSLLLAATSCTTSPTTLEGSGLVPEGIVHAEDLLVVDCLLPGQVRKMGRNRVYLTPRRPTKTSAHECELRGGEYVAYDRADLGTALRVWLVEAEEGDPKAQTYVGEIYERGLGREPDPTKAAQWYQRAADQGYARAMINLGQLYERGVGVERDGARAIRLYQAASGLGAAGLDDRTLESAEDGSQVIAPVAPSIQLIEPAIPDTRALSFVPVDRSPVADHHRALVGRVDAPGGLTSLQVNGESVTADSNGLFRARVAIAAEGTEVAIVAVDRQGRQARRRFRVEPPRRAGPSATPAAAPPAPLPAGSAEFGRYRALVIGISEYEELPRLLNAGRDAEAVGALLEEQYGFDVTLLRDATRYDILSALNRLRAQLNQNDNLLVYYAGHGELDEVNQRGHWLPADAERESTTNWISNVSITDTLNAMDARHVMVVSDSCYSGSLTRSALSGLESGMSDEEQRTWLRSIASKRSRTALTSGGLAPVLDVGGGGHSVFAGAFLGVLTRNREVLEGQRLFQELAAQVTYAAESYQFEQRPEYAPIQFAGHEAGDFLLVPQD